MPPFEDVPWRVGEAKEKGFVFGPLRAEEKELAWTRSYGCMPGTVRVAGQTQWIMTLASQVPSALARYLRHPKGVTPKAVAIDCALVDRRVRRLFRVLPRLAPSPGSSSCEPARR